MVRRPDRHRFDDNHDGIGCERGHRHAEVEALKMPTCGRVPTQTRTVSAAVLLNLVMDALDRR
jgi:hypothetical protein